MKILNTRKRRIVASVAGCIAFFLVLGGASGSGCDSSGGGSNQKAQQQITQKYSTKLRNAEPYPLSQMNDSAERANLREKLLRLNNPNKIGYVYLLSNTGSVITHFTIKGKVSSTGSQLTNSEDVVTQGALDSSGGNVTVPSMQDDGSYGSSECESSGGVFFFTTNEVLVEWCGLWMYSDAPLNVTSAPILTINANAAPSSTAGQRK